MRKQHILFTMFLTICIFFPINTKANSNLLQSYNYNFWGETIPATPAYDLERIIEVGKLEGVYNFGDIADINVGDDKIFIADRAGSQIIITDHDFNFITRITLFKDKDNKIMMDGTTQMRFVQPEGVFEANNGDLYVADTGYRDATGAGRIVIFSLGIDSKDRPFYYVKQIISKPTGLVGRTNFIPSKLIVDNAYRIYTIVQGGNEGIIELNADGSFSRYFGIPKRRINFADYFWKQFASQEQIAEMDLVFAPPFNNLDIDNDGFIYTTNADPNAINSVERINPSGTNVLRENGNFRPIGDVNFSLTQGQSEFSAVAVNDFGMYAVMDQKHGRIFVYNFDGELYFILSNFGNAQGEFKLTGDIAWLGDKLVASDKKTGLLYVYKPTQFGQIVIDATKAYHIGDWDTAGENWLNAIKLNTNFDIAYVGYGKMLYMNDQYEEALNYFELGNNRTYYSMAYKKYRSEYLRENFLLFLTPLVLLTSWVIYTEYRYNRKGGGN